MAEDLAGNLANYKLQLQQVNLLYNNNNNVTSSQGAGQAPMPLRKNLTKNYTKN